MKSKNQVRPNRSAARLSPQVKTPVVSPILNGSNQPGRDVQKFLIPSKVAREARAAMDNLNRVGNAATAYVMMNGYKIQQSSKHDGGWEIMDVQGFSDGAPEFARQVSADFQSTLTSLGALVLWVSANIESVETAVEIKERPAYYRLIDAIDPKGSWHRIESVVGALVDCIGLQSWALCLGGGDSAQSGAYEMSRNLEAAHESVARVTLDLLDSFCAVEAITGEPAKLRRAA